MYSEALSIIKIQELYYFLLGSEKINYKEIREVFGINHKQTIRKYFDFIEEIYNVTIHTELGKYGGSYIYKKNRTCRLGRAEEKTIIVLLTEDYGLSSDMKKALYSILVRLVGTEETDIILKKIKHEIFSEE